MALATLFKREVKAFVKNPAFIAMLVLLLVFYSAIGKITGSATEIAIKEASEMNIGLVVEEETDLVRELIGILNSTTGGRIRVFDTLDDAIRTVGLGIVIPRGFTDNATAPGIPVELVGGVTVTSLSSIGSSARLGMLSYAASIVRNAIPLAVGRVYNISMPLSKDVIVRESYVVFYGRRLSIAEFQMLTGFISFSALFIAVILGVNASQAASMTAIEKVEKAFEMLLAQPIKRRDIVLAKILGASTASILFGVIYIASIFSMIFQAAGAGGAVVVSDIVPLDLSLIGALALSIILGLVFTGAIGVVVGGVVSDERIASILAAPITFIIMGIGFYFFFIGPPPDISTAVVAGLSIAPITYVYALSITIGNTILLLISIAFSIATCCIAIVLAAVIFNRDIVVLGLRIGLRRRLTERA